MTTLSKNVEHVAHASRGDSALGDGRAGLGAMTWKFGNFRQILITAAALSLTTTCEIFAADCDLLRLGHPDQRNPGAENSKRQTNLQRIFVAADRWVWGPK